MNAQKSHKAKILFTSLVLTLATACAPKSSEVVTVASSSDLDKTTIEQIQAEYLKSEFVNVNIEALRNQLQPNLNSLKIELPGRAALELTIAEIKSENDAVTAIGHLTSNEDSNFNLTLQASTLLLTVTSDRAAEHFEIRTVKPGLYIMGTMKPENGDDCEVVKHANVEASTSNTLAVSAAAASSSAVIDILVVYTPAARSKEGGKSAIETLITKAITETNQALKNSKLSGRVRLVGARELSSNETGNYSNDLAMLAGSKGSSSDRNGKWDEVHKWRNELGADQVTMLGAYNSATSTLGLGYKQSGNDRPAVSTSAFTVTKTTAARRYYTVTHELGHNLGLDHSDGYKSLAGKFQTIIKPLGSYGRILYFSSPSVLYKGRATGTSTYNEAKVVSKNFSFVAGFRSTKVNASPLM